MNDKSNGKLSLVTVGGIGIAGTLLGTLATFLLISPALQKQQPRAVPPPPANIHAFVYLYDGGVCKQRVGNIRFSYPVLRPHRPGTAGDIMDWQGIEARKNHSGGNQLTIDVEFDPNNSPFADNSFRSPSGTTNPTPPSREPVGSANDYDYLSVTVDGVPCTKWDPGVHVDQ